MNKIKFSIMTLAILLSIGGAFATRPHYDCRTATQYYLAGGAYNPAGKYGVNYICQSATAVCTYTFNGVSYVPCTNGSMLIIPGITETK
jgi:Family of unknown function (DUF6520)